METEPQPNSEETQGQEAPTPEEGESSSTEDSNPAEAPAKARAPIKKLAPPKAARKVRAAGGTIVRLSKSRAKMTPAARRRMHFAIAVSVIVGLGAVGAFLGLTKPWENNDPPPSRPADALGAEGMKAWAVQWAGATESEAAQTFVGQQFKDDPDKATDDAILKLAISRSREMVKEHGLPRARASEAKLSLDGDVIASVNPADHNSPLTRTWRVLLAASNICLELEKLNSTQEVYEKNHGKLIEDMWLGEIARAKVDEKQNAVSERQAPLLLSTLGLMDAYGRYSDEADGKSYRPAFWEDQRRRVRGIDRFIESTKDN